jgi:DNA-binding GntR family transcriptional regulator
MEAPIARTMSAQIAARLRDKILSGVYAPGSTLLQDSIAAEFGVSKIPVREALVHLRAEGLVNIHAHRGFQVRPLSANEVQEVFRLRLKLEPTAVGDGAKQAIEPDHVVARSALAALTQTLTENKLADAGDLNCAFHLALIVPRLQPVAFEILSRLHTLSQRYVRVHLQPVGRIRRATKEHNALFAAWQSGNAKEASRLTLAHIEETRDELTAALTSAQ